MGVEPKIGFFTPQIIHFSRVLNHYFHHPFWGTTMFGNTHILNIYSVPYDKDNALLSTLFVVSFEDLCLCCIILYIDQLQYSYIN